MRLTRAFAILLALLLAGCGAVPNILEVPTREGAVVAAPPAEAPTAASTVVLDTPAPTAPPAPTAASTGALNTPAPTATTPPEPTVVPSATAPLFIEPTARPGSATAAPAATTAPTEAPTSAAAPTAPAAASLPQAGGQPVRLVIGAIDLDRNLEPVGLDANRMPIVLPHDIGWYTYSARPGEGENVVLWGHVLRFRNAPTIPAPFARLKELKPGSQIALYDDQGAVFRYVVTDQVWATPDQVEYMLPRGREIVTMISCIGDKVIEEGGVEMTHRLITIAEPER